MVNLFTTDERELLQIPAFWRLDKNDRNWAQEIVSGKSDDRGHAFRIGFRLAGAGRAEASAWEHAVLTLEREIKASLHDPERFGVTLELESGARIIGSVDYWDPTKLRVRVKEIGGVFQRVDYSEIKSHGSYNI